MKTGRKSLKEELQLFQRYSELSVPYFAFLKEMFESKSKEDKKWATERIEKAFVKMIPQELEGTGEGGEFIINILKYGGNNPASQLPTETLPGTTA